MKLNNTKRKYIAHILDHLNHNKIASESYEGYEGWYKGSRDSFVKMHKETIEFVESMLKFLERNK